MTIDRTELSGLSIGMRAVSLALHSSSVKVHRISAPDVDSNTNTHCVQDVIAARPTVTLLVKRYPSEITA